MELKDFVVTPLYLLGIYFLAYVIRDKVSDSSTRRYFIPGLTVKIIGAIALGLIYQFYYEGGDTFNYFTHGSKHIWEAFKDAPAKAFQLIFLEKNYSAGTYDYAKLIWYYGDPSAYFVVRITAFFDLLTFHTYSATAVLFACLCFSGLWALYISFYRLFPRLHFSFAIAVFFIPSVFFWGSGILKDTLTLGALGWATHAVVQIFFTKKNILRNTLIFLVACAAIYVIKIYILLCFLPAVILWLFFSWINDVRSIVLRLMLTPLAIGLAGLLCYLAIVEVGEDNRRYALNRISETAEITARYLYYISEQQGGSGYTLGDFDYTTAGMVRKLPLAINVTLFRPYLWEAENPVMFLASLESLAFLLLTVYVLVKSRFLFKLRKFDPILIFCMLFSLAFAFSVGFSTYNFGSLVRYKIPLIPFYLMGLSLIAYYSNKPKKLSLFDATA